MVSRMCFVILCFVVVAVSASAWQDNAYDQMNALQEILDRNFAQEVPNVYLTKRSQDELLGRRIRVCGRQLVNMLQLVCRLNQSAAGNRKKRSFEEAPDSSMLMSMLSGSGLKTELGENPLSGSLHLVKRGASQDCCHSPCTMGHLMTYCPK